MCGVGGGCVLVFFFRCLMFKAVCCYLSMCGWCLLFIVIDCSLSCLMCFVGVVCSLLLYVLGCCVLVVVVSCLLLFVCGCCVVCGV